MLIQMTYCALAECGCKLNLFKNVHLRLKMPLSSTLQGENSPISIDEVPINIKAAQYGLGIINPQEI